MKDILNIQVKNNPEKTIVIFENKKISYRDFNYMVNNVISVMKKNNSRYIGLQIQNKLKLLITLIAINRSKKIPILYPNYPNLKNYIDSTGVPVTIIDNSIIINKDKNDKEDISYIRNDIQIVVFTSGSSGVPKPCQISFDNLYYSSLLWNDVIKFKKTDVYLNHMPLTHISGLCIFFRALYYNFTMVLKNFNSSNYLNYLNNHKINLISTVPYMLKQIIQNSNKANFEKVKAIIIGGEHIDNSFLKLINRYKIPGYISYGMTETCSGIAGFWSTESDTYKPHSNVNINVNNNQICIQSKTVMVSYMHGEKYKNIFQSNDIGQVANNGSFIIEKRIDNIINSGGEKFSTDYAKKLIEELEEVKDCEIKIIKCTKWGKAIHAYIKPRIKIDKIQLNNKLKSVLPNYMHPKEIFIK